MTNFTAAQAKALFESIRSYAQELGIFEAVATHDPWNAPGNRLFCSITLGPVRPLPADSGMIAVTGQVTLLIRVWSSALQKPLDNIDPELLGTLSALIGQLAGGFTLGGTVRDVDLMGLSAVPAYVDFEGKPLRVIEITCPVVINDMWAEAA